MQKELLSVLEAAHIAGIGRTFAYQMIHSGEWPSVKIGRIVRVPRSGFQSWLDSKAEEAERNAEMLSQECGRR